MHVPQTKGDPGDLFCDLCQDAIAFLEQVVLEGFIEGDLEALVTEICNVLPWPVSTWCSDFLDENIEAIIADIVAGIDSLNICANIGLCGADSEVKRAPKAKAVLMKPPGDVFCHVCKDMVDYIALLVLNGTETPAIEELVAQACGNGYPAPVDSLCANFFSSYIDEIIAAIAEDREDICAVIGICQNPRPAEYKRIMQSKAVLARRPQVKTGKGNTQG
jgi:hypothetical protein